MCKYINIQDSQNKLKQMAIIYTYPTATPTGSDNLIGTQVDPVTEENKTVQFGIADINSLASSNFIETTVTITNAEWLALNATPKTLIAAPGANKAIKLLEASVFFDYAASSFDWTTNILLKVSTASFGHIPNSLATIGADYIWSVAIYGGSDDPTGIGIATNTALVTSGGGTTAGGGQVQIKLRYQILDISTTTSF
jgi:hypothetical protein